VSGSNSETKPYSSDDNVESEVTRLTEATPPLRKRRNHPNQGKTNPKPDSSTLDLSSAAQQQAPNIVTTLRHTCSIQEESPISNNMVTSTTSLPPQVLSTNNANGKRKWDKFHFCLFCGVPQKKLPQHLEEKHDDETEIQRLKSLCGKERNKMLTQLRNMGNHKQNCDVLRNRTGTLNSLLLSVGSICYPI
jgi:hypothetical protein